MNEVNLEGGKAGKKKESGVRGQKARSADKSVAVGFNPRLNIEEGPSRSDVRTTHHGDRSIQHVRFERRYATDAFWPENRGLKPTATFVSALRAFPPRPPRSLLVSADTLSLR